MNRITKLQLWAMLLIPDAFLLLCFQGKLNVMTLIGIAAGIAVQAVILLPISVLCGKKEHLPKLAMLVVLIYIIFSGGLLMSRSHTASHILYIPFENTNEFIILTLIALVCLYMSSTGIKALARASVIAAAVGALYLIILSVSAVIKSDYANIARAWETSGFASAFIQSFLLTGGLGTAFVLFGITKGKAVNSLSGYFIARLLISAIIILSSILTAGGISAITDFPVITAAQLAQPFSSQRIDSLLLIVFSVFAVFSIAVQSVTAAYLIRQIFPKFRRFRSIAAIAAIAAVSFMV